MPRKRKKSTLAQKPSLVFTESPVHIQKNVPSPVLCARHPPTASSIPAEDLHNLHWVSPQFRNVRYSEGRGRHRLTRQRRHSVAGHRNTTANIGNKENIPNVAARGHSKFKSIKFFGDQTTVQSIDEDVEITIDTDTGTEDERENFDNKIENRDSPCDGCTRKGNVLAKRDARSRNDNVIASREVALNNSDRRNLDQEGSPARNHIAHSAKNSSEKQKSFSEVMKYENEIYQDFSDRFEEGQSVSGTQRRKSLKEKPPIKRLFASQLPSDGVKHGMSFTEFSENLDNVTLVTEVGGHCESVLERVEEPVNLIGIRRSARIHKLQELLNTADSPASCRTQNLVKTVLAPNTPENEYGWSKRKRQLIQYIKKKS